MLYLAFQSGGLVDLGKEKDVQAAEDE